MKNFFGLYRNETVWCGYKFRIDSENFGFVGNEFQSGLIRINPNFQSEWIPSKRINPNFQSDESVNPINLSFNPNESGLSELFRKIRFQSDWFGLILINSDWPYSFGLKNFFGLDRNETVCCGYKFRNNSENFGFVRNEFQSESFARDNLKKKGSSIQKRIHKFEEILQLLFVVEWHILTNYGSNIFCKSTFLDEERCKSWTQSRDWRNVELQKRCAKEPRAYLPADSRNVPV